MSFSRCIICNLSCFLLFWVIFMFIGFSYRIVFETYVFIVWGCNNYCVSVSSAYVNLYILFTVYFMLFLFFWGLGLVLLTFSILYTTKLCTLTFCISFCNSNNFNIFYVCIVHMVVWVVGLFAISCFFCESY